MSVPGHLPAYCRYIRNTGQSPLGCMAFDEDWQPIGPRVRPELVEHGLIEERDGGLTLTPAGQAVAP